jgi:ABC-2 type transport system permease protein
MDSESFPTDLAVGSLSSGINARLRGLERFLFPPVIKLERVTLLSDDEEEVEGVGILSYFLPGLAVMGVLFLAQSATRDILRDRESGLLRHLLTAPVSPGDYLLGKCLSVIMVTAAGFALLVAIGMAMGVSWGPPAAATILVLATAVAASGTLLLIMSLVGSERQGDALTTIVIIGWSMLGGAFIPLNQMPSFVKPLSASTLVYWSTDGFNTLILRSGEVGDILLNLVVLFGAGFVFLVAGALILGHKIRKGVV